MPTLISFEDIAPFVRFAQDIAIPFTEPTRPVKTYDHRLFYIVNGSGAVEVNGSSHPVAPGTVLYWMSGTAYRFLPKEGTTLHVIAVNFDFTGGHAAAAHFLPMAPQENFDTARQLENLEFTDAAALNAPIFLTEAPAILPYLHTMQQEMRLPGIFHRTQLSSLMRVVLTLLCRAAGHRQFTKRTGSSFQAIQDYINEHYAEELDNRRLAAVFNYHPNYINQLVSEHVGTSLHRYVLQVRVQQALYLLQTTDVPIAEIGRMVGFNSPSYFSKYFKQCTGYSPTDFRLG
ncbi:MAG: helix-turn-helix domain-containing protein [Clostridia bacterium]|nr:helix-turn-helix domain-containing protein [Clostridia bacterium]